MTNLLALALGSGGLVGLAGLIVSRRGDRERADGERERIDHEREKGRRDRVAARRVQTYPRRAELIRKLDDAAEELIDATHWCAWAWRTHIAERNPQDAAARLERQVGAAAQFIELAKDLRATDALDVLVDAVQAFWNAIERYPRPIGPKETAETEAVPAHTRRIREVELLALREACRLDLTSA